MGIQALTLGNNEGDKKRLRVCLYLSTPGLMGIQALTLRNNEGDKKRLHGHRGHRRSRSLIQRKCETVIFAAVQYQIWMQRNKCRLLMQLDMPDKSCAPDSGRDPCSVQSEG
ncbi:hypothetical protein RND81_11G051800 [Saponaria officinalis]|uniref:Uncharacterized protein n=1 Tax=Saponaria officinalis TaxID=3572 RepID=A0AAW1HI75_SAPOF